LNLPNLITLARLLSVPVAIGLVVADHYAAAFWVFVGAGLSDAIDGYIANGSIARLRLARCSIPPPTRRC
jgi:cardiolipin synthase